MSELYESVIVIADSETAHSAFRSLSSPLHLRLIRLSDRIYAANRVATREDRFDEAAINEVAAQLSKSCGHSLAVFYDNRCGVNDSNLFRNGSLVESFGEEDELWVPLDDNGYQLTDGERFTVDQLDEDEEYDCIQSGIDVGLATLGVSSPPSQSALIGAFCYDRCEVEAEHTPT